MKKISAFFLCFVLLLSGCGMSSDMFATPEMTSTHRSLLDIVSVVKEGGLESSEPRSGLNRQPLQLMDLDGDGVDEGIAFLRDVLDDYKSFIYIFAQSGETFRLLEIIEGPRKEILTVSYSDIVGKDGYEMIVEWGTDGEEAHPVTIYNLTSSGVKEILNISAEEYSVSDIDGDGISDFLAFSQNGTVAAAEIYTLGQKEILEKVGSVAMSSGGGKLLRLTAGNVSGHTAGVFVERERENGIVTDVVIYGDKGYTNLLPKGSFCQFRALCADVNGDGITEIPTALDTDTNPFSEDRLYRWSHAGQKGTTIPCALTYHAYSEDWFLLLPLSWQDSVFFEQSIAGRSKKQIRFFTRERVGDVDDMYIEAPLFSIYALYGENQESVNEQSSLFTVYERENMSFAAEIESTQYLGVEINEQFIKDAFKIRQSEWASEILFA